ncbi:hypothetical protein GCM10011502_26390 [Oceanisphaera marina]|uniref:DUF4136 domain-containing protein n=1 Tax=Oceanisphaera marina TaxID=2017550 RepID=A0ABQ1IXD2_9GAMM|nr:DUF4136 domain-containing protein [Oceanisphaera marina]GGB51976.1 hypothetical protein GCM10011502_26390 [Oceanisphaera marina]
MRILRLLIIVLLLGACTPAYDYAEDVDFTRFNSVSLAPDSDLDSLDGARIAAAARARLPARGLKVTAPEQASLWLHYQLKPETRLLTTMPRMLSRHGHGRDDEERVYGAVRQQKLLLWLTLPASERVVWRSTHSSAFPAERLNGAERSRRIEQQVAELLATYPPVK